jgi:phosphoenolpyruvate synthase/pyruvate phosphate dikinase|tara:strand:- start:373 stop:630 length:258 start_codon:yes stop_codon:yes gene_type:complete
MVKDESYINKFSEFSKVSIIVAGGKGANLGEITKAGFAVPSGIVVNTGSYNAVVKANNLQDKILSIALAVLGDNPETSATDSLLK